MASAPRPFISRDDLPALLISAAWLAAALVGGLTAWVGLGVVALLALGGAALAWASRHNAPWLGLAQLGAGIFAVGVATVEPASARLVGIVAILSLAAVAWQLVVGIRQRKALEQERAGLARQVDRRISEIFSLQELSYILAESLQSERIASQVARYVTRFLNAEGSAIVLTGASGQLRVAAAEGSLADVAGRELPADEVSLVLRAMASERIEVTRQSLEPLPLLGDYRTANAAAAPLRAHGLTMGVLAVADRREGSFSAEDLWLLSTVATHVAVVLANSRLFEMVRQAKDEWETAFNAITDGIAMLDGEGRFARVNGALARMLDAPATALPGRGFWETVVGEGADPDRLIGAARRGERPPPLLIRSSTLDREIRLTAAPLSEAVGEGAVVVLVADVTEQRALETQLIQSEKLAAVGQLVSGVAHELNNPLTSIAGLAEFLQERLALPAADQEHLRVIHEQAERAGRIVRNLLTFARKGSGGTESLDLNDLVERTARLVAYELELRGVTLVEESAPAPLPVRGNRDELQQVLVNLVSNAGQALRGLPEQAAKRITLTTAREGESAVLRVRDTGPGVPDALVPRLFTPFFTTKEPGQGTGLGLSLSYRIAEAHGGSLSYRRPAGGGAEFTLSLPLARGEAPVAAPPPPVRREALLVDNDPKSELIVRALLEPEGFGVEVAKSGGEAGERLAGREWALVIMDGAISADGRLLLADQLASRPGEGRTRLVVSTADPALAGRCRVAGMAVLPRPFLPKDLLAVLGGSLAPQGVSER
ncbi:MAG TPA: ATP-binding protein [Gemmatimonadales bacterium]|nr:ATP-binding protein [Gemmatimonadales bacterium]